MRIRIKNRSRENTKGNQWSVRCKRSLRSAIFDNIWISLGCEQLIIVQISGENEVGLSLFLRARASSQLDSFVFSRQKKSNINKQLAVSNISRYIIFFGTTLGATLVRASFSPVWLWFYNFLACAPQDSFHWICQPSRTAVLASGLTTDS